MYFNGNYVKILENTKYGGNAQSVKLNISYTLEIKLIISLGFYEKFSSYCSMSIVLYKFCWD